MMIADTEKQLVDDMYDVVKQGRDCRDTLGAVCPYQVDTIEYFLHTQGWLQRDLQIALCRADPIYRKSQANHVAQELIDHA